MEALLKALEEHGMIETAKWLKHYILVDRLFWFCAGFSLASIISFAAR